MANHPPSHYLDIGEQGEDLVTQWLESTGWLILHRRFNCRWGEIDIIAEYQGGETQEPSKNILLNTQHLTLAFVEVKTRSPNNWDDGGRSAISAQKQTKLWRTAQVYLAKYPEKADYNCRFDVAVVSYQQKSQLKTGVISAPDALFSLSLPGYELYLQEYIPAAFDASIF